MHYSCTKHALANDKLISGQTYQCHIVSAYSHYLTMQLRTIVESCKIATAPIVHTVKVHSLHVLESYSIVAIQHMYLGGLVDWRVTEIAMAPPLKESNKKVCDKNKFVFDLLQKTWVSN